MNVTKDTQELIVASVCKDSYLFSICKDEMDESYFTDPACKVIYKALKTYYKNYSSLPRLNELLIVIEDCYYPQVGVNLVEVKDTVCRLWEIDPPDETFIKNKITDFLRKVRSTTALKDFVDQVKNNPTLESDSVVAKLAAALDVHLSSDKIFQFTDIDQVKEARQSSVGSIDSSRIIKSCIESLNQSLMYGGWQPGTVNMIVAPPGTGKSMYLVNEGACALKQNFDVLHILIGDLTNYDGFIRYLSCVSGTPQNSLVVLPVEKQYDVVNFCNQQYDNIFNRLYILAYPSLSVTVDTLAEDINKFERQLDKDFGMIIVDYPDNLIQEGSSLYTDGGTLYSSLEKTARLTKSVILVASQPKLTYWSSPIIPLEGASDSAKKQMCVDVMLTMNTESRGANFGTLFLAKARKGQVGKIFRFSTDFAQCKIEEINESVFNSMKSAFGISK